MTDIIERLENASYENAPSRCFEAAREIKRLRGLVPTLAQQAPDKKRLMDLAEEIEDSYQSSPFIQDIVLNEEERRMIVSALHALAAQPPAAPSPGAIADRGAIAQALFDEDYQDLNSYELADAVLKHWDVRWKGAQPPAAPVETDADLPTAQDVRGILGPASPIETCQHAPTKGLDGKWVCQKCNEPIEMAVAHSSAETEDLPAIPDDDGDFTPELARKIIWKYQTIIGNLRRQINAPPQRAPGNPE